MSMIKKLIALTLALAMVLSVSAFAGYSDSTYADADKINEDCEDAVELLYALDIMVGDGKNFNPESSVTRAEMAKMIYVILNYGDDDKAVTYTGAKFFADVEAGSWYEGYVNYAAATKLVQGRPDGTFGPNDPVTAAEAAKMLLTAIGYSAEARGYTGANWDKNVLSDASIIGLLNGYKANVNTYAPRQWVAVMMANALDALTFESMQPSFSGLLTSGSSGASWDITTMGEKYYGIVIYEGYLVGANGYKIDNIGDATNKSGRAVIEYEDADGDTAYKSLSTSVSIEDLGQHFKVITVDGSVVSMRNTGKSVVGEAAVKDVEWELTYSTSDNKAKNRYEFTVGELTGKLNVPDDIALANVLDVVAGNKTYTQEDVADLQEEVEDAGVRNDEVRAIDRNGDGDIDYVIYTPVEYAYITKTGTSQKYGDYVRADGINGAALEINNGSNLYLNDSVYSEDELEKGNVVKFTWDIDEGMYCIEVLDVIEAVEFESRKSNKNQFTFGGETYGIADNAFNSEDYCTVKTTLTGTGVLDKDFDIVVDGDLLVYAVRTDDNYKSMDEVNANLAVLIKADVRNTDDENDKQVKLLTIDGEQAWYAYDVSEAKDENNDVVLTWAEVKPDDDDENAEWDQLVIVHTNDDGEVYLEKLVDGEDLALETNLVDLVDILIDVADDEDTDENEGVDEANDLDVDEGKAQYGEYRIGADYQFFAKIDDEYTVITMADLEDGEYDDVDGYALVNEGSYYDSVVGGYLKIGDAVVSEEGFLFVTSLDGVEDEDGTTISVLFADGTEADIYVDATSDEPGVGYAYYYTFDGDDYKLESNWEGVWTEMNVEAGDELWYKNDEDKWTTIDLEDYETFALKTIENLLDMSDIDPEWEVESEDYEFVSMDDLVAQLDEYVDMLENDDYTYSFEYEFCFDDDSADGNDALYIKVIMNMVENNENDANIEE